jgi:hypothetical protein
MSKEDMAMKRLLAGLVATIAMMAIAPTALAYRSYCESWYYNGQECYTECWHYADDGTYLGHVTIDYQC